MGGAGGRSPSCRGLGQSPGLLRRALLLLPLAVAACASPEPSYFTLAPVPGQVQGRGPRTLEIRRIGLARYLDRDSIVRADQNYRLQVASAERWGEPLGDMIGRVLAEELTQRLPGTTVFTEAGAITTDADASLELDVQRFDADGTGQVMLLAQAGVQRGRNARAASARPIRLTIPIQGRSTPDLVAAMSRALGQLADVVAGMMRGM